MLSDVTDFPLPDSPTIPSDSPRPIWKVRSRTAGVGPKLMLRCSTSSRVFTLHYHTNRQRPRGLQQFQTLVISDV